MVEERFLALIENAIKTYWNTPAFSDYNGATYTYRDFAEKVEKIHVVLERAGVKKGDKIALIGRNSANWAMTFFGVLSYGAVIVPILHDFKPDNVHHIVNHSESKILFVGRSIWENLNEHKMSQLEGIFCLSDFSLIKTDNKSLEKACNNVNLLFGKKYPKAFTSDDVKYHEEKPDELAVLSYTSGTTSFSKGVMIPYRSLWSNTRFANEKLPFIHPGDNIVCMLPMAHMYGLAFEILNSVSKGNHIHFLTRTPSPKIIMDAFASIRPTLILAVPLIIEKIVKNKIFPILDKPLMKLLLKIPFVDSKVLVAIQQKMSKSFGDNFMEVIIGGAALNKDVEMFLRSIHFRYTVGYGMTECGPLISYEQWDTFKQGSCGRIVDRMEVKIASEDPEKVVGEIHVRGMNTMLGYYKNEEATQEIFLEDGWMNTGDLGILDKDGFLYIKGRSKTMILGASGQNIYPEEIEDRLNNMPYVAESLVVQLGDKLVALIYPDWDLLDREKLASSHVSIMEQNRVELNKNLPGYSQIASIKIHPEEFEKTPKRSIKRYRYQPAPVE
jgi:long-chain acyl-CoA synthetase